MYLDLKDRNIRSIEAPTFHQLQTQVENRVLTL